MMKLSIFFKKLKPKHPLHPLKSHNLAWSLSKKNSPKSIEFDLCVCFTYIQIYCQISRLGEITDTWISCFS
jgi:hypothetical protein